MKKVIIEKIYYASLLTIVILASFSTAKAATGIEINSGSSMDSLPAILEWLINVFLVGILGIIAFVAFLVGGFMYLLAGSDAAKAEKGKKTLAYAVTGMILAIFSYSFTSIIVDILNNIFQ
jgi:di/tricarboxylate transporter